MQVHSPAYQLLSPLDGEKDKERDLGEMWDCFPDPSAYRATEGQCHLCPALPRLALTDATRVCPGPSEKARQCRSSVRGESSVIYTADISGVAGNMYVPVGHHVPCGYASSPAFDSSQCHNEEIQDNDTSSCGVHVIDGYRRFYHMTLHMSAYLDQSLCCTVCLC